VSWLEQELQRHKFTVFSSANGLPAGVFWPDVLQAGVRSCRCMVVLCSPGYGRTPWTKRELMLADSLHKLILPLWHSGVYPPPATSILLQGTQFLPTGLDAETMGYTGPSSNVTREEVVEQLVEALFAAGIIPSGLGGSPTTAGAPAEGLEDEDDYSNLGGMADAQA
jgi:TIR domain